MDNLHDSLGGLPLNYLDHKHVSGIAKHNKSVRRTRNHIVRAEAKRISRSLRHDVFTSSSVTTSTCRDPSLPCTRQDSDVATRPDNLRHHLERDVRAQLDERSGANLLLGRPLRRGFKGRSGWGWVNEEAEGLGLATSELPLPSDRFRDGTPVLQREDAFRDAATSKGRVRVRHLESLTEDAQTAQLYAMGLLYDNDKSGNNSSLTGEGFNINQIYHDEPLYPIRAVTRTRKGKAKGRRSHLELDLSFADLGGDESLAQYLVSPAVTEISEEDALQTASSSEQRNSTPLRVIYELDGSNPSVDVDTSQPPDLIPDDILSDYECLSESDYEVTDIPAEDVVVERDGAISPTPEAWVVLGDGS